MLDKHLANDLYKYDLNVSRQFSNALYLHIYIISIYTIFFSFRGLTLVMEPLLVPFSHFLVNTLFTSLFILN
jgi:hypothetical protein